MNVPSDRAIYHSKQLGTYVILLFGCKFLKAICLYVSYDLLQYLGVVTFLWGVLLISGLVFVILQKPFTNGRRLSRMDWLRILRCALLSVVIQLLLLYGLTLCGPLRYILLAEHHEIVVVTAASALYAGTGGASKTRGAVMFLLGAASMLLIDHDSRTGTLKSGEKADNEVVSWLSSPLVTLFGLSDHKGGVVLLLVCLCVQSGFQTASKTLAANIGGTKRLHAFVTLFSALFLTPLVLFGYFTSTYVPGTPHVTFLHAVGILLVLSVFMLLIDFYVSTVCSGHLGPGRASLLSTFGLLAGGLLLSALWSANYGESSDQQMADSWHSVLKRSAPALAQEGMHSLSNGLLVAMALILYGVYLLTSNSKLGSQGQLIGISPEGLPVYNFASTGEQLHKVGASLTAHAKTILKQVLEEEASRRIFLFLCLNFAFMFVEMLYGVWTNSLGLISDGFHMMFDSISLLMGLYARVVSRWQPNRTFTFGYHRAEVLSAFINSLFLVVISLTVLLSALNRLFDPPEINSTNRLMVVSVAGLVVNLVGVCALGHTHTHSHGGGHKHAHESSSGGSAHGHSHGGGKCTSSHSHSHSHSHAHSHEAHSEDGGHENSNLRGVYLHVLADTLGSCAVIFSSFLIQRYGWLIADPICSLFLAALIFRSALPLVAQTVKTLALQSPTADSGDVSTADMIHDVICCSEDVLAVRDPKLWCHTENNLCATIHVLVTPQCREQTVLQLVTEVLKRHELDHLTVQVEKDAFYHHMFGMGKKVHFTTEVGRDGSVSSKEWFAAAPALTGIIVQGVEHI